MYSVLIVDDEYTIRKSVLSKLERLALPYIGEIRTCCSGEEALVLCRTFKPQIVITDIEMGAVSGLELIPALAGMLHPVRFVVLSGYDDYRYVRGAFQEGIVDYLLKPLLTSQLREMMEAVVRELQSGADPRSRGDRILAAESLLPKLAAGPAEDLSATDRERLRSCLPDACYLYCAIRFDAVDPGGQTALLNAFYDCLEELFPVLCAYSGDNCLMALVGLTEGGRDSFGRAARGIPAALELQGASGVAMGVSEAGGLAQLSRLRPQALAAMAHRMMESGSKIFWAEPSGHSPEGSRPSQPLNRLNALLDGGRGGSAEMVRKALRALSSRELYSFYRLLSQKAAGAALPPFEAISNYAELEKRVVAATEGAGEGEDKSIARIAKRYLDDNYMQTVSLADMAKRLAVSYSHLSREFHAELGISFTDYLSSLRMKKAAELLRDPTRNVQEVGNAVGYENIFNFSRAFKRYYGVAPSDYRKI